MVGAASGWLAYQLSSTTAILEGVQRGVVQTVDKSWADDAGRASLDSRTFAARSARIRAVSQIDDYSEIADSIRALLLSYGVNRSSPELLTLFIRCFEIDPEGSLRLLEEVDLSHSEVSIILSAWAEIDVEAVVGFLPYIRRASTESLAALAVLQAPGNVYLIDDLVARGSRLDSQGLELAWLIRRSELNFVGEMDDVPLLNGYESQRVALTEVAQFAAIQDPDRALQEAETIRDRALRTVFLAALLTQWARVDPTGFFDGVESLDSGDPAIEAITLQGFRIAAEHAPEVALSRAAEMDGELRLIAESAALYALASVNPLDALNRLEGVSEGRERDRLLQATGEGLARYDLEFALAWLSSASSIGGPAYWPIVERLATKDLYRAIDKLIVDGAVGGRLPPPWLLLPAQNDLSNPARLLDRLHEADLANMVAVTARRWAVDDPFSALAWVQSREVASPTVVRFLAQELAQRNVDDAINFANFIPESARADWIVSAATRGAQYDPEGALAAIERFKGEPYYEQTRGQIVSVIAAGFGHRWAIAAIGTMPTTLEAQHLVQVWVRDEPREASQWAASLSDPQVRSAAVESALRSWVAMDADEALDWAQLIPDSPTRDRAIEAVCRDAPTTMGCE